jgi:uncharacterized protein with GYD domain
MMTFVMLTRLSADAVRSPSALEDLEKAAMERIRSECPQVKWLHTLAVLGPYDYVDIFQAPDVDTAMRVGVIIRTFGHATTETMVGTDWQRFKGLVRDL